MKNRLMIGALLVLAACSSSPENLKIGLPSLDSSPNDLINGDPNLSEVFDATDNTPATIDLSLNASIPGWSGVKAVFNDPKEYEIGKGVTSDTSGNVIVVGASRGYAGTTGEASYTQTHPETTVIRKFNSSGTKVWDRTLGSSAQGSFKTAGFALSDRPTIPAGVVTDPSGNIYIAGYFGTGLATSNQGQQDAYLIKYNPSGNIVWSRVLGASGDDGVTGMAINGTNIYLTGYACGNGLNFAGKTIRGACDVFVSKYESNGNRLWARLYGSNGNDIAAKITKVSSGGAVIVGTYQGALDANGATLNSDGFVTRIDPSGNTIWNRTVATPKNDNAFAVTASNDAVYVGGDTRGSLDGNVQASVYGSDAFLTKLSLDSAATQWTRYVMTPLARGIYWTARVTDFAFDSKGQLFVFGNGYNQYTDGTDISWPVQYNAAGDFTGDAGYANSFPNGFATGNIGSDAKAAMGVGADGVFVVLDSYLTRTPASRIGWFDVAVAKLGFDLKLK
jgi:hypothetical protein